MVGHVRRRRETFTKQRLLGFIAVHFLTWGAEIVAIVNFAYSGDVWFCGFLLLINIFSGAFCAHAAWHCDAPQLEWRCQCLPLRAQAAPRALLLTLLLGLCQGIIVLLAFEEYHARRGDATPGGDPQPGGAAGAAGALPPAPGGAEAGPVETFVDAGGGAQGGQARKSNKFHCKAVNGLFEGLLSSAILLYAYWSLDFPSHDMCHQSPRILNASTPDDCRAEACKCEPITRCAGLFRRREKFLLGSLGIISFLSSGLGLLELDFCTSRTLSRRMRKSPRYEFVHLLFRSCEVGSKVSVFIFYMVATRLFTIYWWVPLALDFSATLLLVLAFGGNDSVPVRLLVSIPCSFANVFAFIDTPYKRRAAARLSRWLDAKHVAWLLLLPFMACSVLMVDDDRGDLVLVLQYMWHQHWLMIGLAVASVPMHGFLLWYVRCNSGTRSAATMADIYSACAGGNVSDVRSAINNLTQSAAVGLNVNKPDIDGNTPLVLAAGGGHAEVCQLLLQEGACASSRILADDRPLRGCFQRAVRLRWTALHIAAARGHAEVAQVLVEAASAHQSVSGEGIWQDPNGDTPLHVAAHYEHEEVARVLAAGKPDWSNTRNNRNRRPIDLAQKPEVQRAISTPGPPQPPSQEREGAAPLLLAASRSGLDSDVGDASEDMPSQAQWREVRLAISRVSPRDELMAPGLCSYVASSCGGALGQAFLAQARAIDEGFQDQFGSLIESGSESGAQSFVHQESPRFVASAAPAMEDLQPVDHNGQPIAWWIYMVNSQSAAADREAEQAGNGGGRSSVLGDAMSRVPQEAFLGQGMYGTVWRGKDRKTGDWYAVKNIRVQQESRSQNAVARRESEVADHIRMRPHPCIVELYHVHNFTESGLYVLVMEFCPGGDLVGRIRRARQEARAGRRRYQPPSKAMSWIGQVFLGLEHMHRRMTTLLRDLKPDNVVLSSSGHAKLTDFGFGRFGVESAGDWSFGFPTGSPGYVAPEVLKREPTNASADLYSFGVLVWVLLAGGVVNKDDPVPPIGARRHAADFDAHRDDYKLLAACLERPERNSAIRLPQDQSDFVKQLTARRPEDRMTHRDIRRHRMFQQLPLPPFRDPPAEVRRWLGLPPSTPMARGGRSRDAAAPDAPGGVGAAEASAAGASSGAQAAGADPAESAAALLATVQEDSQDSASAASMPELQPVVPDLGQQSVAPSETELQPTER